MRHMVLLASLAGLVLALGPTPRAFAQDSHMQHAAGPAPAKADNSPASQAFRAANAKMHKDMDFPLTGKVDVDFLRGMIAHHQGAIDMARVQLQYGRDEKIRKLAQDIIDAQEAEIAWMKAWLGVNAKNEALAAQPAAPGGTAVRP